VAEQAPMIFIGTRVGYFATTTNVQGFAPTASQTWRTLSQVTVDEG
jgi:ABC-type transport system substrate-binding protein